MNILPETVSAVWQDAASALQVTTPLRPYADVVAGLEQLSLRRFLLTTGFRRLQESKVRQLRWRIADLRALPALLAQVTGAA